MASDTKEKPASGEEQLYRELGRLRAESVRLKAVSDLAQSSARLQRTIQLRRIEADLILAFIELINELGAYSHCLINSGILHRGARLLGSLVLSRLGGRRFTVTSRIRRLQEIVSEYQASHPQQWLTYSERLSEIELQSSRHGLHPIADVVSGYARDNAAWTEALERDSARIAKAICGFQVVLARMLDELRAILNSFYWRTAGRLVGLLKGSNGRHEIAQLTADFWQLSGRAAVLCRAADRLQLNLSELQNGAPVMMSNVTAPIRSSVRLKPGTPKIRYSEERVELSIIVLNRNGERHLNNLFCSFLKHNSYPHLEFIVVDHGSTDGSVELLHKFKELLPLSVIESGRNFSFSYSNNRAAERARGRFFLFLNNDIIWSEDVLPNLVSLLESGVEEMVGVHLYYPGADESSGEDVSVGTLQHAGIQFREDPAHQFLRPFNVQDLEPYTNGSARKFFPCATAAALLCRRDVFKELGGFCESYNYGYEDVDLCLSYVRHSNRLIRVEPVSGLIHDESSTQVLDNHAEVTARRRANIATLKARHGEFLRTVVRDDLLSSRREWTDRVLRVGFAVTEAGEDARAGDYFTALELGTSLEREFGWEVEYLPQRNSSRSWYDVSGLDILVVMLDGYDVSAVKNARPGLVRMAWMRNWFARWVKRPWFDAFDLYLCSSQKAANFVRERAAKEAHLLRIATNPDRFAPGDSDPSLECDYCFVGSYFGANRDIEAFLKPDEINGQFRIYGQGWDEHLAFESNYFGPLDYKEVVRLYRSAKIVLDDANHVTKQWGSVNSRVFDALAAGCLVISNGAEGAAEVFDGELPVYRDAVELKTLIERYLADDELRRTAVERCRRIVMDRHTYAQRAGEFKEIIKTFFEQRLRISIKVPAPSDHSKHEWGDYHFGLSLKYALEESGHSVRIDLLADWDNPAGMADDVVIVLRGLSAYEPKPGQINLMWNISQPEKVPVEEYNRYDHVFVASTTYAEKLREYVSVPVSSLLQCTDPRIFYRDEDLRAPKHDILFVGNSRKQPRAIVMDSIAAGLPIAVYGSMWQNIIPSHHIYGEHIRNDELRKYYSAAGVVLNDHWPAMRENGFLSNRIFDAGLCGACIISDPVEGLEEPLRSALLTYESRADLERKVKGLLADESARRDFGDRLRAVIAAGHTFSARAASILDVIRELRAQRHESGEAETRLHAA